MCREDKKNIVQSCRILFVRGGGMGVQIKVMDKMVELLRQEVKSTKRAF